MKLSPPASSSDLEAAREVARRLNRVATPPEPPRPLPPYTPLPLPGGRAASASPPPPRPFAAAPPPAPRVPAPHVAAPHVPVAAAPPPPIAPVFAAPEPAPGFTPEPGFSPGPEPKASAPATEPPPERESIDVDEPVAHPYVETAPAAQVPEVPPPAHIPVAPAPPLPTQASVPDREPDTGPVEEVEEIEEDMEPEDRAEEADSEAAVPLTWSEIVSSCQALAEGKGALLINPEGRVVAVSGDWPSPGAEAIASRLVPAMDKALKDAPTRSVSVPLGGLHLTAWRAPMTNGLMTIGFVADAPLRPDLRPPIDATLKKGPQD